MKCRASRLVEYLIQVVVEEIVGVAHMGGKGSILEFQANVFNSCLHGIFTHWWDCNHPGGVKDLEYNSGGAPLPTLLVAVSRIHLVHVSRDNNKVLRGATAQDACKPSFCSKGDLCIEDILENGFRWTTHKALVAVRALELADGY